MIPSLKRVLPVALLIAATRPASAQQADPRIGLKAGLQDAAAASKYLELVGSVARPEGFYDPDQPGNILFANSDMAFQGSRLFLGSFAGFQVYDLAERTPRLRKAFICPGGQGDLSIYRNLLFMSVEMPNGRIDCGTNGDPNDSVSVTRFKGVRIFDISDIDNPRQVAAIQTCRGSHTHTLVTDPRDRRNVYIYVQGASLVRSPTELAGCSGAPPEQDPNTSNFRIEIIKVPVAHPEQAAIVNMPRIFADPATGAIAGLWKGGALTEGGQSTATTNHCHDITAYSTIGLAAGACSGNGIVIDISDPANPKRIAEVSDPNFAYWHSATFNNDGTKVLFTDEWGGGMAPRCQAGDDPKWGADAIFTISRTRKLEHAGYYKMPAAQSAQENCVAHNGSLIPVPGRDIMVQAWYQGGVSVFDFTDAQHPIEIGFFDRGPYHPTQLMLGGYWSTYWYNGRIYGSEIGRGLDVFELQPSPYLTQNEIDAAKLVHFDEYNPQNQPRFTWPASFVVARAYIDQLARTDVSQAQLARIAKELDRAASQSGAARRGLLKRAAASARKLPDSKTATLLAGVIKELAKE